MRNLSLGHVDQRPIQGVTAADVEPYQRAHFFAGIGGWEYTLRLARWPDAAPVWTGSCPCQPYSAAGKGLGDKDPRNLWPELRRLIDECRPAIIFGEQVASKSGRAWLARVRSDLEAMGYTVGAADLCAAGIGAPHIRQRLFWVAYSAGTPRAQQLRESWRRKTPSTDTPECSGLVGGLADSELQYAGPGVSGIEGPSRGGRDRSAVDGASQRLGNSHGDGSFAGRSATEANGHGYSVDSASGDDSHESGWIDQEPWRSDHCSSIDCIDGKRRRIPRPESGIQPLAYGIPRRMGTLSSGATRMEQRAVSLARGYRVGSLRGYGNAIVPQLAAVFVTSCIEALIESLTNDAT